MKKEMAMMPNGNYEEIISPIQHRCRLDELECVEYGWELGKLKLNIEVGDPYEDGFSRSFEVMCCPICSYQPERSKREDLNDGYFPPQWNVNDHPEKTKGWIEFQKAMRKDPKYYLGCGTLNSMET